ncbi:MAG: hypothetical protein J6A08_07370 [Lachnospiraceae bacterium]|nr:hypothetical protein [Lachnospiraceae bacterium]
MPQATMSREQIDSIIATPHTNMTREQIDSILNGNSGGAQTSALSVSNEIPMLKPVTGQSKPFVWSHEKQNEWLKNYTGGNARAESANSETARERAAVLDKEAEAKVRKSASLNQSYVNKLTKKEKQPQEYQPTAEDLQMFEGLSAQIAKDQEKAQKQITIEDLYTPAAKQLYGTQIPQKQSVQIPTLETSNKNNVNSFLTGRPAEKGETAVIDDNLPMVSKDFQLIKNVEDMSPEEYESYVLMNSPKNGIPEDATEELKQAFIDMWSQPDYKLSDTEKKQAKKILEENEKNWMSDYAQRTTGASSGQIQEAAKAVSDQQDKMAMLELKVSPFKSFQYGFMNSLPFVEKYAETLNSERAGNYKQSNLTQNPGMYYGGAAAEQMAEYAAGTKLMKGLGVTDKIGQGTGKAIKNAKLAEHAANVLSDTALDVALDTIPSLAQDVKNGENAGTVAKNTVKNVGGNLMWNVGGEALGAGVDAVKKSKKVNDVLKNPDAFTMETGVRLTGDAGQDKKLVSAYLDKLAKATDEIPHLKNDTSDVLTDTVKETEFAAEKINVGKATTIYSPYKGDVPVQADKVYNRVEIPQESYENALINMQNADIDSKLEGRSSKKILTKVYETLFSDKGKTSFDVNVKDMTYGGKAYDVTVNKGAISKIMSDKNMSAEKIAVIDNLENVIADSKYVGSGNYAKTSKTNVQRYDYFEADIKIHGEDYVVTYDVEVIPGKNNYRTHKVINEMNLSKTNQRYTGTGNWPAVPSDSLKGSNDSISNFVEGVNNEMNLSKESRFSTDTGPVPAVSSNSMKGSNNIISDSARNVNQNILDKESLSKKEAYRVPNDIKSLSLTPDNELELTALNSNISDYVKNVNNPPPRLENKVMPEDIGLGSGLPFATVYDNTRSVAESMGLPDIRKYGQGDTLKVGAEKVSKFRTNTLAKEANFSAEEAAEIYGEDFYKYIPTSEKETFEVAAKRVSDDADGWYKKIMSAEDIKDYDNAAGVDTMMQLGTNYRQQARAAKEAGNTELARTLYAKSRDMTLKLSELERKAGQELQALQKYSRTSDKTILNGEKILQDRITETAKANPRLMEEVDDVGVAIYNRVRELEQSDLWKQLSSSDAMQPTAADVREQLRKEVSDIIKQESGKSKALKKKLKNSSIDKLADDIIELNHLDRINSALESFASNGIYGMSDDVIDQVTDIFAEAEKYDFNSKKRVELESQAYALIAQEVSGTSFHEMFKNWRYLAMLGNTKTHIRNMVSTTGMYATSGVKNNVAAVIEAAVNGVSKKVGGKGIERTKSVLNPVKDRSLIKASLSDADNKMYRELKGNMYTGSIENSIESNKRVFRGKTKVTDTVAKGVDKVSKLNSAALDAEDYFFVKHKYSTSLAGYMKANGLGADAFEAAEKLQKVNGSIDELLAARQTNPFKVIDRAADAEIAALDEQIASLKNAAGLNPLGQASYIGKMDELEKQAEDIARSRIDDQIAALRDSAKEYQSTVDILDKGRQYAKEQAEETAFHQNSKIASELSKFSNTMEESGIPGKAVSAMVEGVVPFKKTPVNVLKNGLAYSPANALKNLTFDIHALCVKKITPAEFINNISKTLTGTGIFAMGCALYNNGVATAVTDKFDELTGNQTYSIQIGDKTYTLDWAAPDSISFFAGVSAMEELKEKGISLEGVLNALAGMSQPVLEMSMMDGVNNALESIQYMDKDNIASSAIGTLGGTVGGSYLKQAVPTLMGQIGRTVDNTRRSTYTDKTGFAGALDREVIKMTNKIPGLSRNNQPYVDAWGREQENLAGGNLLERAAYQMLSPSYIADVNMTPVDKEVKRLYDATADDSVLPTGDTTKKIDDVRMTKEEYTVYSKAAGQARYNLLEACMDNANYNALDEDVQAEVVKDLYNLAKKIGSAEARAGYTSNDSLFKTYQEKGLDAAVNYAITKQAEDVVWVPISETTNSERYDQVNSMKLSDEEKGYQLRTSANNSEVADRVYKAFGKSDAMVYQYYTLDEMAKKDSSNKTEKGEDKTFAGSSLGKQYEYIAKTDGSEEEKGKMLVAVNSSDEKVQLLSGAFGDAAVTAYAQADSLARNDIMNSTKKGEAKSFSQSNITKQYEYVNQLSGVSDEVKGTMIYMNQTSSDKVVEVYEEKGGEGVMEYAKIKSGAHKGSGNLKKDELVDYLNRNYSSNATKKYWFKMIGNEKWKCPY